MQPNVMSVARNGLTKGLWSKPLLLAAAFVLLSGSAFAQMSAGRPPAPGAPDNGPTPLEQQRQKQIDNDYKAATKNIPGQKAEGSLGRRTADPDRQEPITPYPSRIDTAESPLPPPWLIEDIGALPSS